MQGAPLTALTNSCHLQADLHRQKTAMASFDRQHQAELACKAADMAALTRQHETAQCQAAEAFHAQLAAMEAQHTQQLQQAMKEAQSRVLDTEERLQDVKDLLVALQARFNNRCPLCLYAKSSPWCPVLHLGI